MSFFFKWKFKFARKTGLKSEYNIELMYVPVHRASACAFNEKRFKICLDLDFILFALTVRFLPLSMFTWSVPFSFQYACISPYMHYNDNFGKKKVLIAC